MQKMFWSQVEAPAVAVLTAVSDDLQEFLSGPEELRYERLPRAVAAIEWLCGNKSQPYEMNLTRVCRQTQTDRNSVRRLFIGSFIRYWTQETIAMLKESIGAEKMRMILTHPEML